MLYSLLIDFCYLVALCLVWPLVAFRRWRRGQSVSLADRLGNIASRRVAGRCVWIHGVSLGEINATTTLVATLRRRLPAAEIVISSTTDAGLKRARELYPDLLTFRYPLDLSFVVRRVFDRARPNVIVLMELELWPNLIEVARARGVPVLIANGRITAEKSVRRFQWPILRSVARRMFRSLAWVGAQERAYADRFELLGVPRDRIEVTGSLKFDTATVGDFVAGQDELAREMGIDRGKPLWVCGSTGPDEEAMVLEAFDELRRTMPELQLAIVPRKPERFDEVARLVVQRGFACLRRSTGRPTHPADGPAATPVFLGDTLGELRKFYALANVVFVGRTLIPQGGSDLMEVAGLARAMVVGPHLENFAEAAAALVAAGGMLQVPSSKELAGAIRGLLSDAAAARTMGLRARQAIVERQGATERTAERIAMYAAEA